VQTPQEVGHRSQQKGEQNRQYDGDHHLAAEIEAGDNHDSDSKG
jgi:hypothetical protein